MNITVMCIAVFISQLAFLIPRTWNVRAVSQGNVKMALLSGAAVHIAWLFGTALSVFSMTAMVKDFRWEYLPVVLCSLVGGLLGTYIGMKMKRKPKETVNDKLEKKALQTAKELKGESDIELEGFSSTLTCAVDPDFHIVVLGLSTDEVKKKTADYLAQMPRGEATTIIVDFNFEI